MSEQRCPACGHKIECECDPIEALFGPVGPPMETKTFVLMWVGFLGALALWLVGVGYL